MKAEVVCFASAKGGSGKTVLTASIASFLSAIGKKCLIIDCDAATHGMTLLYLSKVSENKNKNKKGLFEFRIENNKNTNIIKIGNTINIDSKEISTTLDNGIITIENSIDVLPATYNFTLNFDPEEFFEKNALLKIINLLRNKYDHIFLDAQAGSDKYSKLAMRKDISDKVVIVSEYDPLSSAGIERLKQVIGNDLDYTRTWILLNKMLPEFVDKFSEFMSVAKYLPPIPWNADIVRAYAKRKLALDLNKGNVFTLAILRTVKELFGEEIGDEISEWKKEKTFELREPLEEQFNHVAKELQGLFELRNRRREIEERILFRKEISLKYITIGLLVVLLATISIFTKQLNKETYFIILTIALSPLVAMRFIKQKNKSSNELEDKKLDIKIKVLEEKLKQLEAMRSANLETIVRNEKR